MYLVTRGEGVKDSVIQTPPEFLNEFYVTLPTMTSREETRYKSPQENYPTLFGTTLVNLMSLDVYDV